MLKRRKDRVPKGKMRWDKIRRQVTRNITSHQQASLILMSLVDCLWGAESDADWSPDTIEAVANLLHESGLGPDCLD